MVPLFVYLIKLSFGLGLFLLFYWLLIKKEKNFRFNRFYLLSALALSAIMPLIRFSDTPVTFLAEKTVNLFQTNGEAIAGGGLSNSGSADDPFRIPLSKPTDYAYPIRDNHAVSGSLVSDQPVQWNWKKSFYLFYLITVGLFFFHFIFQLIRTILMISGSEKRPLNRLSLVLNEKVESPFSFGRYVVINHGLYSSPECEQVIAHESEHLRQYHFIDVFLTEVLRLFFWISPMVWLLEKEIKENHEYLADWGVLQQGFNKQAYQRTLLGGSFGWQYIGMASFLNQSFIKKRITMMSNLTKRQIPAWKFLVLIPMVLLLVFACASRSNENTTSKEEEKAAVADYTQVFQLNKEFSWVSYLDGNFFCKGSFTFDRIDEAGIWHGEQFNRTQFSTIKVTAKVSNNNLTIYTGKPWNETWKVTRCENGTFYGSLISSYAFALAGEGTFMMKEEFGFNEMMPDNETEKSFISEKLPLELKKKYYWENFNQPKGDLCLTGWIILDNYNAQTGEIEVQQYNYRTQTTTQCKGTLKGNELTFTIGEPWNEVWKSKLEGDVLKGELTFKHNAANFKESGTRTWILGTRSITDRHDFLSQGSYFREHLIDRYWFIDLRIHHDLIYPIEAKNLKIEGVVFVTSMVCSNGELSEVHVIQGIDPLLDNEAVNVVKSLPVELLQFNSEGKETIPFKFAVRFAL